ncbi:MAG: hypothetical protein BWY09_02065 [Candidatus Hydrogenedentes bacterium ADurb.Bin179]|nr:MAG: hypothetical protein BWY09_02065 [Candidatus Hydrogenedentes bacterium ADurb.Bin179]
MPSIFLLYSIYNYRFQGAVNTRSDFLTSTEF